jgi:hypothetical protein
MGLMDTLRRVFRRGESSSMRDRYGDRAAGVDPKFDVPTPSGTAGPSGTTLDKEQGEGGAIEPDPRGEP